MNHSQSPFADDFLSEAGLPGYRAAITLAATRVSAELAQPESAGLVDGYAALKATVDGLPLDSAGGVGLPGALDEAVSLLAGSSAMVTHPGYLAHLHCPPTVSSLATEVLISAFNQSLDSFDQAPAATAIEQRVIEYLCAAIGYAFGADGTFTSGGTQSNLQALLIARDLFAERCDWNVAARGLPPQARSWRVLCTRGTHFSVHRALRLLGLGADAAIEVPTDAAGRLCVDALADCVAAAARARTPIFALVLTAGTTDYGAIDPLEPAITLARDHGIWTHVDACAGGCLVFSDRHRHLVAGMELADSVAIDFHKLLFQAISCSALLVRRGESFDVTAGHADYLNPADDADQDVLNLVGKSVQTTRRFDALKVFVTVRALGGRRLAEMIDATCAAAAAAAAAADRHHNLVLAAPVATNTVVVRWRHPALSDDECDGVNNAIRAGLARSGRALVGRSRAAGRQGIKLTFVNPLVTVETAAEVIADIADQGERIHAARGNRGQQRMNNQVGRVERIAASDARFPWAKNVEYTIFGLENDFADESDVAAGEMVHYRAWEPSSEIFVSFSEDSPDVPVGVLRALRWDQKLGLDSFSTLRDTRSYAVDEHAPRDFLYPRWRCFFDGIAGERIAELATQGVRKRYRRAGMIEQIWQAFFSSLAADGVEVVTVALVVPLFEWYHQLLPERIHQIGDVLPDYIGADSVPAVIDISGSFVTDTVRTLAGDRGSLLAVTTEGSAQ